MPAHSRPGPAEAQPAGGDETSPADGPSPSGLAGAATNPVDLHTHSTFSDGTLTPAELVREAARRGVRTLALTDHDTVEGLPEAEAEAARLGLELVPGVELSTGGQDGEPEIHLLGYFLDHTDPALREGLAAYAAARLARLDRIVERLAALGVRLDPAHVRRLAGPGTVGRPHIARALVELGHAETTAEAFDRYLGTGRPGFVPRPKVEPERGIALIRAAGGAAVLAHPLGVGDAEAVVARLGPAGLVGMEVDYGGYDVEARRLLRGIADRHGLISVGGSDYHGPGVRVGRELGGPPVAPEAVARLRAAASSAAGAVAAARA